MRVPRFYTTQSLVVNQAVLLEASPSHHLLKVLRAKAGDPVILFNGDGHEYRAFLQGSEGKLARIAVTGMSTPQRESGLHISLGQGISRAERMDLVIQKAVELGVAEITPLWTRRSQVQLSGQRLEKRLSHWRGILLSACEQSGRVHLPQLHTATRLDGWLGAPAEGLRLVLDPQASRVLHDIEPQIRVEILLGPEGGFEDGEMESALAAGFAPVRLGPRVLRTETATLAALAALQTLWGDFATRAG
jgi:16S rRNA (uracil1498-N3)-methyltransferase